MTGPGTGGGAGHRGVASPSGVTFDATLYARRIREHRRRLGLTQVQLAGELVGLSVGLYGVACGANDRLVRSWESGEKRPGPYYQRLLCELFVAAPADLGFRAPLRGEVEADGAASLAGAEDDDDVRRRRFLELAGTLVVGQHVDAFRRSLDAALDRDLDGMDIEEYEQAVHAYGHEISVLAPAEILPELLLDFDEVRGLIARGRGSVEPRLLRVAGQLAALIAHTVVCAGRPQAARRWWRTVRRAADSAGDRELAAIAYGQQAVQSLYGGYAPTQVIDLADRAVAATARAPSAGLMSALAARAQALAAVGDRSGARRALEDVTAAFERLPDEARDGSPAFDWSEDRLHHVRSYVHSHLADERQAEQAHDRALELYDKTLFRGPTQVRLHRATRLILGGDPTEGVRYATQVLDALPPARRTDGFVRQLAHDALAAVPESARALPPVAEYRELLQT